MSNITKLIEKGLFNSKDLRREIENSVKFKMEILASKLDLVKREEFEVQKKIIQKIQKDIVSFKKKKSKKKKLYR